MQVSVPGSEARGGFVICHSSLPTSSPQLPDAPVRVRGGSGEAGEGVRVANSPIKGMQTAEMRRTQRLSGFRNLRVSAWAVRQTPSL
jgi:hypothetical protein